MFPKKGNKFPAGPKGEAVEISYASAIGQALRSELGGSHRSVKTIMRWTTANERTVKNWLAGTRGPRGDHLIDIIRHSDAVLETVMRMAGRDEALTVLNLVTLHDWLVKVEAELDRRLNGGD